MTLHLFEGFGVEIEHMIVDRETLAVRPYADRVLIEDGAVVSELEDGEIAWSNELASHVIELKTNGPAPKLDALPARFAASERHIAERLEPEGAMMLPGAMHPFMNPDLDFLRWPHDYAEIYATFDRIFDCRGHGWSNLQSVHLNLPFNGDDEFGRLHAAIRAILPIIPALSAASPIYDGQRQPFLDARLDVYRDNARNVPMVSGRVIPEPAFSAAEYDRLIFQPLYEAIAPHDPEGTLRNEWLNARGAIARFDRDAIEIRVIDAQESAHANLAICAAVTAVLEKLIDGTFGDPARQRTATVDQLKPIFDGTVRNAEGFVIDDRAFLSLFEFPEPTATAGALWSHLFDRTGLRDNEAWRTPLAAIEQHGTLATRIVARTGETPKHERLLEVWRELAGCLADGTAFGV